MMMRNLLAPMGLVLGLFAAQAMADSAISVDKAYARAVPPTAANSAAFMVIHNQGDADRAVVAAASDVSEVTELHDHINDNGVMRMRQVAQIPVPAGGSVELKPGSLHVMLIGLKKPLAEGDQVNVTLIFDDKSEKQVSMQAQKMMMGHHQHMHH